MDLLTILLLAAAASSDSFIIGFNYGVRGVRIGNASNLFLSLICFAGTLLSMLAGRSVSRFLEPALGQLAGGFLFAGMGLWMLRGALKLRRPAPPEECASVRCYSENPEMVDKDNSKVIELRESAVIGLMLCLNNIGLGVGGGMAGIPILSTPLACSAMSFLFIRLGCLLGGRLASGAFSKALEIAASGLLMLLGVGELCALLA